MPRSKSQNALKSRKARRALPAGTAKPTVHAPRTLDALRRVGPRPNVIQIVPPRHVYRPSYLRAEDKDNQELVMRPLASPTGPGGAKGFRNRGGSQIATPHVTNVYLGDFWGDRNFFEGFSKAIIVEDSRLWHRFRGLSWTGRQRCDSTRDAEHLAHRVGVALIRDGAAGGGFGDRILSGGEWGKQAR